MLPKIRHFINKTYHPYELIEAALVLAMIRQRRPEGWDEFLTSVFRKRLAKLFADSFDLYLKLILVVANREWEKVPSFVEQADAKYLARAADISYLNFDVCDGGGMYNEVRMDYRLATILKWIYRDRVAELNKLTTIHKWSCE